MNDRHIKTLISDYIDDALSAGERRRIDAHVEKCQECREELDALQNVSKLVASLPSKELPDGFMTRLRSRRRREESAPASPWLVFPRKSLALGLTGFIACFLMFREIRYRLAPTVLSDANMISGAMDRKISEEFDYSARQQGYDTPADQGRWSGLSGPQAAPGAGGAVRGLEEPEERVNKKTLEMLQAAEAGRPVSKEIQKDIASAKTKASPASRVTNERLRSYLDAQSRAMGIKKIMPPSNSGPVTVRRADEPQEKGPSMWDGVEDKPMTRDEARQAMRRMTKNLYEIRQQGDWKRSPTVPIDGRTPQLIAKTEPKSGAIGLDSPPPVPKEAVGARSIDYAGANAAKKLRGKKQPDTILVRKPSAATGAVLAPTRIVARNPGSGPVVATQAVAAAGNFSKHASDILRSTQSAQSARKDVPRILDWTREWNRATGGMPQAGGAVIKNAVDWADMHQRVPFAEALPPLDFDAEMAVAVYGEPSMEQSRKASIVSVTEENGRLMIRYRTGTDTSPEAVKPSAPFHIVIVPKSDLPFSFVQVP